MNQFGDLGNGLLIQYGPEAACQSIETWIKVASTCVSSVGMGGKTALKEALKDERIDVKTIILSCVIGAFTGYGIGSKLTNHEEIKTFIDQQMTTLNDYFAKPENRHLLPEGVIKHIIDHQPGHAKENHGPLASIFDKASKSVPGNAKSRFTRLEDLYSRAHDCVAKGSLQKQKSWKGQNLS